MSVSVQQLCRLLGRQIALPGERAVSESEVNRAIHRQTILDDSNSKLNYLKSNISIIQRSQSKILCMIANAPWYVPNITLHEDLNVPLVKEVIKQKKHKIPQQNRRTYKLTNSTVTRTTQ
jgi:hypothetical protein